jgi:hypothetical protein
MQELHDLVSWVNEYHINESAIHFRPRSHWNINIERLDLSEHWVPLLVQRLLTGYDTSFILRFPVTCAELRQ